MPTPDARISQAREALDALDVGELLRAGVVPQGKQFLPVVAYPPITMYPPADGSALLAAESEPPPIPYASYVHIPFCASACRYCHWVKAIDPPAADVDDYVDTLCAELALATARLGGGRLPLSTALFGGGTPTFLKASQLERLLGVYHRHFDLEPCRQFSVEAEPASLLGEEGRARLEVLASHGVQRISLGVQSFEDAILESMNRRHSGRQALQAIEAIRQAGIDSVSIDLIYGYLGQSLQEWIRTMETTLSSGADAWQLYRLRIRRYGEVQAAVLDDYERQPELCPEADHTRLMKMLGILMSEQAGFHQHFIRIFSRSQDHITHFMWDYCCELLNVVGVGPSAWSNHHRRFTLNVGSNSQRYRDMVRQGQLPIERGLFRDRETEARRSLILPLKNDRVYKRKFQRRTGVDLDQHFGPELARLRGLGLAERDERSWWLTERGRFFADETMWQLTQRRYLPFAELGHELMPD